MVVDFSISWVVVGSRSTLRVQVLLFGITLLRIEIDVHASGRTNSSHSRSSEQKLPPLREFRARTPGLSTPVTKETKKMVISRRRAVEMHTNWE